MALYIFMVLVVVLLVLDIRRELRQGRRQAKERDRLRATLARFCRLVEERNPPEVVVDAIYPGALELLGGTSPRRWFNKLEQIHAPEKGDKV